MTMSCVYACASVPTCTLIIKLSNHQYRQTHIIISIRLNNYITHLKVTRQWHLAAARNNLAAAEQQSRCSSGKAHCGGEPLQLGLSNLSQLIAAKTTLAAVSALCLS